MTAEERVAQLEQENAELRAKLDALAAVFTSYLLPIAWEI
jgi:uncharacterized protein YceH (UPF0502 family)